MTLGPITEDEINATAMDAELARLHDPRSTFVVETPIGQTVVSYPGRTFTQAEHDAHLAELTRQHSLESIAARMVALESEVTTHDFDGSVFAFADLLEPFKPSRATRRAERFGHRENRTHGPRH